MSRIKRVRVGYGMTHNIGNYESIRLYYEVEDAVQEGESPRDIIAQRTAQLIKFEKEQFKIALKEAR